MKPYYEKVPQRESSSFFAYEKTSESFPFSWHYHPEYEITAISSGRGKRYIGDSIDEYELFDLVMVPPQMPHSWQADVEKEGNRALVIQFSRQLLEDSGLELPEFSRIKRLLENASGALTFGTDKTAIVIMREVVATDGIDSLLKLFSLLRHLSSINSEKITSSGQFSRSNCDNMNRLFNYINDNFTGNITLDDAAKAACMSKSAFCRFFKRTAGRRFIDHINDLRISLACKLLTESDKPITEICFETGFGNIANFNRQFKKRKAQSPRQYRKSLP